MRFCFIIERQYRDTVMPRAVVEQLLRWGHAVDVLEPHSTITCLSDFKKQGLDVPDAYVLKTVADGPGLTLLEAAGAVGIPTINSCRSIRLVRDKAIAAAVARVGGLPMPRTYFISHPGLFMQIPPEDFPLVVKPTNGSSGQGVYRVNAPAELPPLVGRLDGSFYLAQHYVENSGFDIKLYIAGPEVYAVARKSPLHPEVNVAEGLMPVTADLRRLALQAGYCFGLDIYGVDVLETANGWATIDFNDFPSFGLIPRAAMLIAESLLELASRAHVPYPMPRPAVVTGQRMRGDGTLPIGGFESTGAILQPVP